MRARRVVVIASILLVVGVACGGGSDGDDATTDGGLAGIGPEVHVYDAWAVPARDDAAEIGLRVHNAGPQVDRLLDATCACEGVVAIGGAVVVAPDEEVVLAPGGTPGLRLTDLTEGLPKGGFVTLTLTFEHAGAVTAEAEVRRAA